MSLHSLDPKKIPQKYLILWNLLGSSYKKMLMKKPKYVLHSLYVLDIRDLLGVLINKVLIKIFKNPNLSKLSKMIAIFEFIG